MNRYVLRIEGARASEFLDVLHGEATIVSLAVRDPSFREAPADGTYPGFVALHVMEEDRLAGEVAYLEFLAHTGDKKAIEELEIAKGVKEDEKAFMSP